LDYGDSSISGSKGNRDACFCGVFVAFVQEIEDSKACEFSNILLSGGGNNILLPV